jgi:hypothetical protein
MLRLGRRQGLPQRQNRHIRLNFFRPNADGVKDGCLHRPSGAIICRFEQLFTKALNRLRTDGSNVRDPASLSVDPSERRPSSAEA